jgi:hypothetical protein
MKAFFGGAALLLALTLSGCGGNGTYSPLANTVPTSNVTVSIVSPQPASTTTGGTLQFRAVVTGTSNKQVTWSILDSSGATISSTGLFQATSQTGTYYLEAVSVADPSVYAEALATVTTGSGTVGGTVQ